MKHIFFVEDDLSLISGLSFALKKQGYELTIAQPVRQNNYVTAAIMTLILDVTLLMILVLTCAGKFALPPKYRSCF
ncbi:MAG: hypothetical protein ACLRWH_12980 [Emergencia sp.]